MFPQNSHLSLSLRDSSSETRQTLSEVLRDNKQVIATVIKVIPDKTAPGSFRIQLEINNQQVQLTSSQALTSGNQLQLSQQTDGKLLIQIINAQSASTSSPKQTEAIPVTRQPAVPTQVKLIQANNQLQIPQGTSIDGTILKSTPLPPMTSGNTPLPTDQSANRSTYSRPIPQSTPASTGQPIGSVTTTSTASTAFPTNGNPNTQAPANPIKGAVSKNPTQTHTRPASTSSSTTATPLEKQPPTGIEAKSTTTPSTPTPASAQPANTPIANSTTTPIQPTIQPASSKPTLQNSGQQPGAQPVTSTNSAGPSVKNFVPPHPTAHTQNLTTEGKSTPPLSANLPSPSANINPPNIQTTLNPSERFNVQILLNDGKTVQLRSETALPPNTAVRITQESANILVVSTEKTSPQKAEIIREQTAIQDALRTALPNQQPLAQSLNQLQSSANQTSTSGLPNLVRSMLQLFGVRPGNPEAASTIRNNIQLGGLQTESQLALTGKTEKGDIKTALRQLQQHAAELPSEQRSRLEQLIQSVQARVTHNQLSSLQQSKEQPDGSFERVYQLDIPIIQNTQLDNIEVRISQEGERNTDNSLTTLWRVRLHFELESLGSVDAEIKLPEDEQLQVQFWCSNKQTQQQIENQLDSFSSQLSSQGFTETQIHCYHGSAPEQQGDTIQKRLVDIHT